MVLTAAPVVRQPMEVIGAPGKTDFVRIFIASELNKPEYRTTLRHEQAHVWARHNKRRPRDVQYRLWEIACEMEIARTIYDAQDIQNIDAPRSRLAGGYVPDSLEGLPPDMTLAEEIYEWLLEHPYQQNSGNGCCKCVCGYKDDESSEEDTVGIESVDAIIQAAREKLDSDEAVQLSQIAAASVYSALRNRPPALNEAVDAALRVRVERERSHRRPSRRHSGEQIVMPGSISTPRPPLVEIFVDRSGSFTSEKTAVAETRLRELLSRYNATIRSDVWFFGNGKLAANDFCGGGNTPYDLIVKHLEGSKPKLAIVITDDDPVSGKIGTVDRQIKVLCVPIGCANTALAAALGGTDVVTR